MYEAFFSIESLKGRDRKYVPAPSNPITPPSHHSNLLGVYHILVTSTKYLGSSYYEIFTLVSTRGIYTCVARVYTFHYVKKHITDVCKAHHRRGFTRLCNKGTSHCFSLFLSFFNKFFFYNMYDVLGVDVL